MRLNKKQMFGGLESYVVIFVTAIMIALNDLLLKNILNVYFESELKAFGASFLLTCAELLIISVCIHLFEKE